MDKKKISLVVVLALVFGIAIGGTMAWLTSQTAPVVNTFTMSNIDITLEETTTDYKMIPGFTIDKDPVATVLADSEKCYLFVKIDKSTDKPFDDYMTYTIAEGWTVGDGTGIPDNVYYRVVETKTDNQPFGILLNNQVFVKDTVTKDMMDELTEQNYPTLTFTAYASQYYETNDVAFEPAEAWGNVNSTNQTQP